LNGAVYSYFLTVIANICHPEKNKDAATGMVRFYSKRSQQIFDMVSKAMNW